MGYSKSELNNQIDSLRSDIVSCRSGSEKVGAILQKLAAAQSTLTDIKSGVKGCFTVNDEIYGLKNFADIDGYIGAAINSLNGLGSQISSKITDYEVSIESCKEQIKEIEIEEERQRIAAAKAKEQEEIMMMKNKNK